MQPQPSSIVLEIQMVLVLSTTNGMVCRFFRMAPGSQYAEQKMKKAGKLTQKPHQLALVVRGHF